MKQNLNIGEGRGIIFPFIMVLVLGMCSLATSEAQRPVWHGLYGQTGIAVTPTAYLRPDRQLAAGWQKIPAGFAHLKDSRLLGVGEQVFFASLGFLPWAEVSMRLVHPDNLKGQYGIGDRSLFLKLGIFSETTKRPAVAIGIYDPIGTRLLPATYIVTSKSFTILPAIDLIVNAGYGAPFPRNEEYLVEGFWASTQITSSAPPARWWPQWSAGAEFHQGQLNFSAGLLAFSTLQFNAWLLDFKDFAFGVSGAVRL